MSKCLPVFVYIYNVKYFRTVLHTQAASFLRKKTGFLKLTALFIATTRDICTKLLTSSESSMKIKFMSAKAFFVILLTSAVISKHRLLHGNEIVQYF